MLLNAFQHKCACVGFELKIHCLCERQMKRRARELTWNSGQIVKATSFPGPFPWLGSGARRKTLVTRLQANRTGWTWSRHVLRMGNISLLPFALTWAAEGKRKTGRPRKPWRRTVRKKRMTICYCFGVETELAVADSVFLRSKLSRPTLHTERQNR